LLKAGADPNIRYGSSNSLSPLYLACRNAAMTRTLLDLGADVKSVDKLGFTPLHWAACSGIPEVVDALIDFGADVEAQSLSVTQNELHSFKGLTPLHLAAFYKKSCTLLALLQRGGNANARDDDGQRPLHLVCKCPDARSVALADLLLRWGADETATDNDGNTP
ncbi:unnamed protein product, partial [Ectocarpus fasciculatus]